MEENSKLYQSWITLLLFEILLVGCGRQPNNDYSKEIQSNVDTKLGVQVVYDGPKSVSDYNTKYGVECGSGSCLLEVSPELAPLKKANGEPICISLIVSAMFSREDIIEGASCQISGTDYKEIESWYGLNKVYNKYLNQQTIEDFITWKTDNGFVTTYKEVIRGDSHGNAIYEYYVYIGPSEHPYYSRYVSD